MRRASLLAILLAACGPETAPDGPYPHEVDMAEPRLQAPPDLAVGDATCGGQQFQVDRVQPNVFLVIDRSGSMANPISSTSSARKWDDLKTAVSQLVSGFNAQIRLGMSLYNRDGDCAAGIIDTGLSPMNGATVLSQLDATSPGGNTPTAATLAFVRQNAGLDDPMRPNVVVLATDGKPNCSDVDVTGKIQALYYGAPSVRTFVIGLGSETFTNADLLNQWAVAGHTDRSGPVKYYQSNSAAELAAAFQSIVGGIASCSFALSQSPPDPSQLYVWLGGVQVPLDAANGYAYTGGPPSVTLNGAACDQLKADPSKKLQIVYGCPAPPPIL